MKNFNEKEANSCGNIICIFECLFLMDICQWNSFVFCYLVCTTDMSFDYTKKQIRLLSFCEMFSKVNKVFLHFLSDFFLCTSHNIALEVVALIVTSNIQNVHENQFNIILSNRVWWNTLLAW